MAEDAEQEEEPPPVWLTNWLTAMRRHKQCSAISIRRHGSDWAIVQVARGMGPRLLMEGARGAGGGDGSRVASPLVASPHYRAYLQNLVLVVQDEQVLLTSRTQRRQLTAVRLTMHCLVEKSPSQDSFTLSSVTNDPTGKMFKSNVTVRQRVPSRRLGSLAWIQIQNQVPLEMETQPPQQQRHPVHPKLRIQAADMIRPKQFRRQLEAAGHAVLGNAEDAKAFRGHGLFMSAASLELEWTSSQQNEQGATITTTETIRVTLDPPSGWQAVLDKERRFWEERHGQTTATASTTTDNDNSGVPPLPAAYVDGCVSFGAEGGVPLSLQVNPSVMIPRPGSFTLVQMAVALWKQQCVKTTRARRMTRVWDLGTGSGCLLLSLLQQLQPALGPDQKLRGRGIDISTTALQVAQENAQACGLERFCKWTVGTFENPLGDTSGDSHDDCMDIVICNPPYYDGRPRRQQYLDASMIHHEPAVALFVASHDEDLLRHYREVLRGVAKIRESTASSANDNTTDNRASLLLVLEVFRQNTQAVYSMLQDAGLKGISIARDHRRCVRSIQGYFC